MTLAGARHAAVHDFGGFPQALYDLRYDVAGVPCLAPYVEQLLQWAGIEVEHADASGLDHGIWVPMRSIRPPATFPCCPSPSPPTARRQLFELGAALRLAGGRGRVDRRHRLHHAQPAPGPAAGRPRARDPRQRRVPRLVRRSLGRRDWAALWHYRALAPEAHAMHPTDEHLLPWFIAAGAGGADQRRCACTPAWRAGTWQDAYAFGAEAPALARALERVWSRPPRRSPGRRRRVRCESPRASLSPPSMLGIIPLARYEITTARLRLVAGDPALAPAVCEFQRRNRRHFAPWDPPTDDSFYTVEAQAARVATGLAAFQTDAAYRYWLIAATRAAARACRRPTSR